MLNRIITNLFFRLLLLVFQAQIRNSTPCIESKSEPGTCFDCSHDYFRSLNMTSDNPIYSSNCTLRATNGTSEEINMYISSKVCDIGSPCNGNLESPFDEINKAFLDGNRKANERIFVYIKFYLLKGPHFVLRKNLPQVSFPFFKRVNASITIQPCYCWHKNISGCLQNGETVEINIKTDGFTIFIARSLIIRNISILGWDIHLASTASENNLSDCYNNEMKCCDYEKINSTYEKNTNPCGLLKRSIALKHLEGWEYRYGLFNLEPILDDPRRLIPQLTLEGIIFSDIYSAKPALSWVALIHFPSNVRGELLMSDVYIINVNFIKGLVFSKPLEYLNPSTNDFKQLWRENKSELINIYLKGVNVTQYNDYEVKLGSFPSSEIGMFSLENFQGNLAFLNSSISKCKSSLTRLAVFSLFDTAYLNVSDVLFYSLDNFMLLYTDDSIVYLQNCMFLNLRVYDGMVIKPKSKLNLIRCIFQKVESISPATRFLIDTHTVELLIENAILNFSQTSIRTYTSTLIIKKMTLSNSCLLRTFFQLKDGFFQITDFSLFNISSAPLTYRNFLFFSTEMPTNCTISNFTVESFIGSVDFILFDVLGSVLGFQMNVFNVKVENSIISTFIMSIQVEKMFLSNISLFNISLGISPGLSIIDSTFSELLLVNNFNARDLYSEHFLFKAAFCLSSINCLCLINKFVIINLARQTMDSIILDLPKISLENLFIKNFTVPENFIAEEIDELTITNSVVQNFKFIDIYQQIFRVSVISIKGGHKIQIHDILLDNLQGNSSEGDLKYKNGFISAVASDTDASRIDNDIEIFSSNIFIYNSGGWPNGVIGFVNIHKIELRNYIISSTFSQRGGVYLNWASDIKISDLECFSAIADEGGCLFSTNVISLELKNIKTQDCRARNQGGVVFLSNIDFGAVTKIVTKNSSATSSGGVFYIYNAKLNLNSILITDSYAGDEGGVIFFNLGYLIISQSVFKNQTSRTGGAASFQLMLLVILNYVSISSNICFNKGSSFYFFNVRKLEINNLEVIKNYGLLAKGNIFIESPSATDNIIILNIKCLQNDLSIGSCIYYSGLGSLNIINGLVAFNKGNILHVTSRNSSAIVFKNSTFSDNEMSISSEFKSFGLAFFERSEISFLTQNYIFNNQAKSSLFYCKSSTLLIENTDIKNNSYSNAASTLVVVSSKSSKCFFRKINVLALTADRALSFFASNEGFFEIKESLVTGCRSYSGCIKAENVKGSIIDSSFEDNIGEFAGVLFTISSSIKISNSKFMGNQVSRKMNIQSIDKTFSMNDLSAADLLSLCPTLRNNFTLEIKNCSFETLGPSITVYKIKSILLDQSLIQTKLDGRLFSRSGLLVYSSEAVVTNSMFLNLNDTLGSAIKCFNFELENLFVIKIKNSTFLYNKARAGGALFLQGFLNTIMESCNFSFNQVFLSPGIGGVAYIICLACFETKIEVLNCDFFSNSAENYAPTIFSQTTLFGAETNNFQNNIDSVNFTEKFSAFPINITVSDIIFSENGKILPNFNNKKTITSGIRIDFNLTVMDSFGQRLAFEEESQTYLRKNSNEEILGFKGKNVKGLHQFREVKIYSMPGSDFSINVLVEFDERKILYKALEMNPKNILSLRLDFFSRPCVIGEISIYSDSGINKICFKCPAGTYSFAETLLSNNSENKCRVCPKNAKCPGGSSIIPLAGYWRNSKYSTLIVECLPKSSCLGYANGILDGEELIHGKCANNTLGRLCSECVPGFAKFYYKDSCKLCATEFWPYVKFTILILIFIAYLVVQITLSFQMNKISFTGILLKLLVGHFQTLAVISIFDQEWASEFKNFFYSLEYFSFFSEGLIPAECLFINFGLNSFTQKIILSNIFPIALSLILFILWLLISLISEKYRSSTKFSFIYKALDKLRVSFFIVYILFFPEIIKKCFGLFYCIVIDDFQDFQVLLYSPDIVCWDSEHTKFILLISIPGIIVWAVILPSTIMARLHRHRIIIREILRFRQKNKAVNYNSTAEKEMIEEQWREGAKKSSVKGSSVDSTKLKFVKKDSLSNESNEKESSQRIAKRAASPTKIIIEKLKSLGKTNKFAFEIAFHRALIMKYLYKGYSPKYYYWEMFHLLKKFILIGFASLSEFFPTAFKGVVLIILFVILLKIQLRVQPYQTDFLNKIEAFSIIIALFKVLTGVILFSSELKYLSPAFLAFTVFFNFYFVLYWFLVFWKYVVRKLKIYATIASYAGMMIRKKSKVSPG